MKMIYILTVLFWAIFVASNRSLELGSFIHCCELFSRMANAQLTQFNNLNAASLAFFLFK